VTLRRSLWARLFGGYWFQTFLSIAVIVQILLIGVLIAFDVDIRVGELAPSLPGMIVIWVLWLFGVFAAASADRAGVRVRYFSVRNYSWNDIERVIFTGRVVLGRSGDAVIQLTVGGADHLIRPVSQCSQAARLEFGEALIALARAEDVAVAVDPNKGRWPGLAVDPTR
jgi:hypothetical protein